MLQKPEVDDDRLLARLREAYRLRVHQIEFLPLGADANTAVYRAAAADGTPYFVKLRRGPLDELSVALPRFLADLGLEAVIPPLRTTAGRLWVRLDAFTVTAYPFVAGRDGYEAELSADQWTALGATLKALHTATLPAALRSRLPQETYPPRWRQAVREFQARVAADSFADPIAAELAVIMRANAAAIGELIERAEQLGRALAGRGLERVLCHGDIHAGNVLIAPGGALYVVDWDTAVLAPKERDLMFVGAGIAGRWNRPEESAWFYKGYGPAEVDPAALAYYHSERIVQDIAAFCDQILAATAADAGRRQALAWLTGQFSPGQEVDIARQTYEAWTATGVT